MLRFILATKLRLFLLIVFGYTDYLPVSGKFSCFFDRCHPSWYDEALWFLWWEVGRKGRM